MDYFHNIRDVVVIKDQKESFCVRFIIFIVVKYHL